MAEENNVTPPEDPSEGSVAEAPRDRIVELEIDRELHDSYLTYAMSTIMDRALPDVRDGLKPSQRRILVAMHDLNLTPGRKHIKCAKIAGDTSGNYHPHGESVIYPTLVNMGQSWKTRCLLVDKQGNFGSIEGDPPAAMRYTEARMTAATVAMMDDIKFDTVDYRPNYDDRLTEPIVLPAKLPNLLINGSSGIAVGMASSMPPHNVTEICAAINAVMDNPEIELPELLELAPGPDFPTGGTIVGRRGIVEAYSTGRGRVVVRGKVRHEERKGRDYLVIEEIPYQVVQSNLLEPLAIEAGKDGRIPDIANIHNHSGRNAQTRILVELKRGADPHVVEKQIYRYTPLQSTFSIINIALVNNRPRTLSFKQLIQCWIDHRREVIRRRTEFLLRRARQDAHKLEGKIYAVCDIDEVIKLIRSSKTRDEAIRRLQERAFRIAPDHQYAELVPKGLLERSQAGEGVTLTKVQAEAIGALRLIQLVGLEIEELAAELQKLHDEIEDYESILNSPERVTQIIKDDCTDVVDRFGDDRRTTIEDGDADDLEIESLIQEHDVVVTISHEGYVKRLPVDTYRSQGRGGTGIKGSQNKEGDFAEHVFVSTTHTDLLCFTSTGRVFRMKVWQIPEMSRTSRGRPIQNMIDLREGETASFFLPVADFEKSEDYLFFAMAQGKVKRTALKDYRNVNRSGIIAVNLNEGDQLVGVVQTTGESHVLLATSSGMAIRFNEDDARVMGRAAAGVKGIEIGKEDEVVGLVRCDSDADLLTVTRNGYGKRTPLSDYLVRAEDGSTRPQGRGGKGRIDIKANTRNGPVVSIRPVMEGEGMVFVTLNGQLIRTDVDQISRMGRNTQGVRVVRLRDNDSLVSMARVPTDD
jgi:DNA gyrase subunit A